MPNAVSQIILVTRWLIPWLGKGRIPFLFYLTPPIFSRNIILKTFENRLGDITNRFRGKTLGLPPLSLTSGPGLVDRLKIPWTYCLSPSLVPKPTDWKNHIGAWDHAIRIFFVSSIRIENQMWSGFTSWNRVQITNPTRTLQPFLIADHHQYTSGQQFWDLIWPKFNLGGLIYWNLGLGPSLSKILLQWLVRALYNDLFLDH